MAREIRDRDGYFVASIDDDGSVRNWDGDFLYRIDSNGDARGWDGEFKGHFDSDGTLRDYHGNFLSKYNSDEKRFEDYDGNEVSRASVHRQMEEASDTSK